MNYKYNELEYAKAIKENGFQTRFIRYEILVLVKYLKELGYSKKETTEFIYDFCEKNIEGYNEVKYYKTIDKMIMDGRKKGNGLIVVNNLPIMNKEISYIDSLGIDFESKKLLLSMLVKRKIAYEINKDTNRNRLVLSPYFNGTKKTFREVFKSSNISTSSYKVDQMVSDLVSRGILTSVVKGDVVLEFMYDIYPFEIEVVDGVEKRYIKYEIDEDDVFYRLNDFENVGYVFEYYKGDKKIKECSVCENLFKKRSNRQVYCKPCWEDKERLRQKDKWHKYKHRYK